MATPYYNIGGPNAPAGQTIARELLVAYISLTSDHDDPEWHAIGKRVTESAAKYDWGEDTSSDILGNNYISYKKPIITQSFEPFTLESGDETASYLWRKAIYEQNVQALAAQDVLIVHYYTRGREDASVAPQNFAERYSACGIRVDSIGGPGGGSINMPVTITYGGTRTTGHAEGIRKSPTFIPDEEG